MNCRFCNHEVQIEFVDLVNSPLSNAYLTSEQLNEPETYYPLRVMVCEKCFLVQVDEYKKSNEIFDNDYAYFSSYSTSWLAHSERYVIQMIDQFKINEDSLVIEIASNDGYLLQYFNNRKIPVLGIEPTANTAEVATAKGIPTRVEFFGESLASRLVLEGKRASLLLGNNVLAHVPDINDFVKGMGILLSKNGLITMEFPHLYQLVKNNQFDTIYHEHFSYLSFYTVKQIFEKHGLKMFDVEEIPTHGGSLRVYAANVEDDTKRVSSNVSKILEKESKHEINTLGYYKGFQEKVDQIKIEFVNFLIQQKKLGKSIVAYGAAAKGNTLLNYCGIKNDIVDFVIDANPHKQNKFLPGSHIPIYDETKITDKKPDYILILPWNIKEEIIQQLGYVREWGAKFIIVIPSLEIL